MDDFFNMLPACVRSFSMRKYEQAPRHRQYRQERLRSRRDESIKGLRQCQHCQVGVCKNLFIGKRKIDPFAP